MILVSVPFFKISYLFKGKCNIFELVGKYYKEAKIEETKEVENVLRLRKSSKKLNLSTQKQRMNVRELNDLTAGFIEHLTAGWNDNERKTLQVKIS